MRALALAGLLAACGAEPGPRSTDADALAAGERALASGALDEAQARFVAVAESTVDPEARALALYRLATIARQRGDAAGAEALFGAVASGPTEERAALAAYQQAMDALDAGDAAGADALRALVDRFPDSAAADKAVKYLATHLSLPEEVVGLVDWLDGVARRHQRFTVADNALWWAAWLRARSLADLAGARADLRRLVETFPESPLADDALWQLARLHARQGQWAEAEAACQALVDLRNEASLLVGSYRSPLLDDAALQIGALRYHGRRDPQAAAWAYQAFLADFPTSTLRDDAWLGLAHAKLATGDADGGRATLRELLREQPQSRHAADARALLAADAPAPWPMDAARLAPPPLGEAP